MRVTRIHTLGPLAAGSTVELDPRASRYASQVLRLRKGQSLRLFCGDGTDYQAELLRCDRRSCVARIGAVGDVEPPAALHIHLGIGVSRGERMDFAIQKSVELGVTAITPLFTERAVVQLPPDRQARRIGHWQGVVISACEQSGRNRVPDLLAPQSLDAWLDGRGSGLLLYHRADRSLPQLPAPQGDVNLLIGPEGGLSAAERARALAAGFTAVRLGPRVLRTETAPLAALAAIQVLWGDLR